MRIIYFLILFSLLYFYSNDSYSSDLNVEECNFSNTKNNEPNYAETEEERITRMDQELEALLNSFERVRCSN